MIHVGLGLPLMAVIGYHLWYGDTDMKKTIFGSVQDADAVEIPLLGHDNQELRYNLEEHTLLEEQRRR